jgi:hypothetical protein
MFNSQSGFSIGKKPPAHLLSPSPDVESPALTYLKGMLQWKLDDKQQVGIAQGERGTYLVSIDSP